MLKQFRVTEGWKNIASFIPTEFLVASFYKSILNIK